MINIYILKNNMIEQAVFKHTHLKEIILLTASYFKLQVMNTFWIIAK